ncbi:MAG: hypothetical protein IPH55_17000, partial [Betaproteobacteria bacterium]|nr:hypothetical protein [Betaproteobacteria bacterium]
DEQHRPIVALGLLDQAQDLAFRFFVIDHGCPYQLTKPLTCVLLLPATKVQVPAVILTA